MPRTPSHLRTAALATLLGMLMAGCRTTPQDRSMPPDDGVIGAAVLVGPSLGHRIQRDPAAWPVEVRPSRAVILADGSLRADVGPSLGVGDRPGVTRHLRRQQLLSLWNGFDDLGLAGEDAGNFDRNPELLVPGPDEVIQILEFRRHDRDWIIVERFVIPEDAQAGTTGSSGSLSGQDPRMRAALRSIAAIAWASDAPPDDTIRFPERYDFGPDPWSRYRVVSPDEDP